MKARTKIKSLRRFSSLSATAREKLAARGIFEADQLACLSVSRPQLLALFASAEDANLTAWGDQALKRLRLNRGRFVSTFQAKKLTFGVVRKPQGISAPGPNVLSWQLHSQRERHAGLPAAVDLSGDIPFVHDQGCNGSCVGHASTAALELASGETLSGSFTYLRCKEIDGEPNAEGTTLEAAISALGASGSCRLETWPGSENESRPLSTLELPSETATNEAQSFRVTESDCAPLHTLDDIKTAIAYGANGEGRGVLAAVPVFSSWDAAFRTGSVPMRLGDDDELLGWHAIFLVGYEDNDADPGGGRFYFLNSWGTDWASNSPSRAGVGSLPYGYIEEYQAECRYLEPCIAVGNGRRRRTVRWFAFTAGMGLLALGLAWWPNLQKSVGETSPTVVAPKQESNSGSFPAVQTGNTMFPKKLSHYGTNDRLSDDPSAYDRDLAEYVKQVVDRNPELRPLFSGERR